MVIFVAYNKPKAHRSFMAYLNSMVQGAQLAFMVGITLAIVNGITARITGQSLDAQIQSRLPTIGGMN